MKEPAPKEEIKAQTDEIDLIIQDTNALKRVESQREESKVALRQMSSGSEILR
jgi:hypothetical protein